MRTKVILLSLFLFVLVIGNFLVLSAQETVPAETSRVWVDGIGNPKMTRLSENVLAITGLYHTGGEKGVTAGIILTENSVIFVDAGMTISSAEFIWNTVQELMGDRENLILILTHHHSDHVFGMRVFKEKGASVIAHSGVKAFLGMRGMFYKEFLVNGLGWDAKRGDEIFGDVVLTTPDQTIEKDTALTVDGEEIHLLYTPGHVPTELSVYHPHSEVLFAGDTVYEGMELTTHFGGPPEWVEWIDQLERLNELDIKVICPGHGSLCTKAELVRNIGYLKSLLE